MSIMDLGIGCRRTDHNVECYRIDMYCGRYYERMLAGVPSSRGDFFVTCPRVLPHLRDAKPAPQGSPNIDGFARVLRGEIKPDGSLFWTHEESRYLEGLDVASLGKEVAAMDNAALRASMVRAADFAREGYFPSAERVE